MVRNNAGCYHHDRASEKNIQRYANTTQATAGGAPASQGASWVGCVGNPPTTPPDISPCSGGAVEVDCNCFTLVPGVLDNLTECRKVGFKNAQAQRVWHGRFGYLSHDISSSPGDICAANFNNIAGSDCAFEANQPAPDQTKYLKLVVEAVYTEVDNDSSGSPVFSGTAIYDSTSTVDATTGNVVTTFSKTVGSFDPGDYGNLFDLANNTCLDAWLFAQYQAIFQTAWTDYTDYPDSTMGPQTYNLVYSGAGTSMHFTETETVRGTDSLGVAYTYPFTHRTATVDLGSGTYELKVWDVYYDSNNHPSGTTLTAHILVTVTNTSISYSTAQHTKTQAPNDVYTTTSLTADLNKAASAGPPPVYDSPNPASAVYADCVALAGQWNLADDKQYPWRKDSYVSIGPLVTRDESETPVIPQVSFTASSVGSFTGAIRGAPMPAGYGQGSPWGVFDWHKADLGATCGGPTVFGAWTPPWLPSNCPQWTNECAASQVWPGAWAYHAKGVIFVQKWAQIKIHRPAIDFARPYGADRFACQDATCGCVAGWDPGSQTVSLISPVTGITTGDLCLVNGGGAPPGVYPVTVTDSSHYVLGTLKWSLPSSPPANVQFGKIRWPNAWPVEGRTGLQSATTGSGDTQFALSVPATFLRTGDVIDLVDASDNAIAGWTNQTVTMGATQSQFTIAGRSDAPDLSSAVYIKSHGAPHYWWFDHDSKGDYLFLQWSHDFRDIGEADRLCKQYAGQSSAGCTTYNPGPSGCNMDPSTGATLRQQQAAHGMPRSVTEFTISPGCLGFDVCWPQVVCCSPNGEAFNNGHTYAFPGSFSLDDRYGSLWQAIPLMVIQDPFWEVPAAPCSGGSWNEDDGGCGEPACGGSSTPGDFAHRPLVEARQDVPVPWVGGDASPALPSDVVIHILTLAELASGSPPSGILQAPPAPVGAGLTAATDWGLWLGEICCVCHGGTFAQDYMNNEVTGNCPP